MIFSVLQNIHITFLHAPVLWQNVSLWSVARYHIQCQVIKPVSDVRSACVLGGQELMTNSTRVILNVCFLIYHFSDLLVSQGTFLWQHGNLTPAATSHFAGRRKLGYDLLGCVCLWSNRLDKEMHAKRRRVHAALGLATGKWKRPF